MINREQAQFLDDHGDDIYGLWEVRWYFDTNFPSLLPRQRRDFVAELIDKELLDFFIVQQDAGRTLVDKSVALELIEDEPNWLSPQETTRSELYYVKESSAGEILRRSVFPDL